MSLELEDVWFGYPRSGQDVLKGLNLRVSTGETVAVMAPSGEGKSTLLSVAGLLLQPQSGIVKIDGIARSRRDASALLGSEIGWVLQSVNLLPRRSVWDNVAIGLLSQGATRAAARLGATRLLAEVGLAGLGGREARTLSGGEQQRVGVARALAVRPAVVLADEPTANLDGATALGVATALVEASRGSTLLLATHDRRVAALADRILVLEAGQLRGA